ncbi:MAG: family 10 glycosylhydrolase [Cyanobacteria bacterium J06597_16]
MGAQKQESGCGCFLLSLLLLTIGGGVWAAPRVHRINLQTAREGDFVGLYQEMTTEPAVPLSTETTPAPATPLPPAATASNNLPITPPLQAAPASPSTVTAVTQSAPLPTAVSPPSAEPTPPKATNPNPPTAQPVVAKTATSDLSPALPATWQAKEMRGIYLSRYQATNRASEQTIRDRVRYYKKQGINTIIHGVWGNGCTMYKSEVMKQTLGYSSCPNHFQDNWLDWLIDEAHKQDMQVHAYFEKGIKLDENSPIFDVATRKQWFVPGIDKTYPGIDHYLLDVGNTEVTDYFKAIQAEFVKKYPTIDAVQWDDYVGYHDELGGKIDRTQQLTKFMREMQQVVKQTAPQVSFDVCHHNPYWGKRYFDADWANWNVDRAFIQVYNDGNFAAEMGYVEQHRGIAISDTQFSRLAELAGNPKVKSVFLFPSDGKPEETAARFRKAITGS